MIEQERETQRRLRVLRHAEGRGNIRLTCRYFGRHEIKLGNVNHPVAVAAAPT